MYVQWNKREITPTNCNICIRVCNFTKLQIFLFSFMKNPYLKGLGGSTLK